MKPSQIHALPDQLVDPWYRIPGSIVEDVFEFRDDQLDLALAEEKKSDRVSIHRKLMNSGDGENWTTVSSLTFDNMPFGIHTRMGDIPSVHITNWAVYNDACGYIEKWKALKPSPHYDASADEDDRTITDGEGLVAMEVNGKIDLVDIDNFGNDGTLIMDPQAYEAAFDRLLRKDVANFKDGFRDPAVRALAAQVISESVPGNLEKIVVDSLDLKRGWTGVVIATSEGTYSVGLDPHASMMGWLSWGTYIGSERIGGPEAIEEFREEASPAP